ncbi:TVP38/TMEM64 family protein [Thermosyntropha lipolytica]|nr:TVP38/TMEM64 family protein [Thermosyntropha lipolytica]
MEKKERKSLAIKIGILVVLILAYFFISPLREAVRQGVVVLTSLDLEGVKEYILSFGIWAPVISFLLMVLQSVAAPLPAFLITFANAGLFGWVKGAILSWTSAMAGAALCFAIARFYGRGAVEKLVPSKALAEVDIFFEHYGKWAVLMARLLPFVSFDIVSYAAGLTSMSFWSFMWATGLGQLPATLIYSYAGDMLAGSARTLVWGLLTLFALSALLFMLKQIRQDKK